MSLFKAHFKAKNEGKCSVCSSLGHVYVNSLRELLEEFIKSTPKVEQTEQQICVFVYLSIHLYYYFLLYVLYVYI